MTLRKELLQAGINADFLPKENPKLQQQFDYCEKTRIPLGVLIGSKELEEGICKIKDFAITDKENDEKSGRIVQRTELINELKKKISSLEEYRLVK